ncbi:citrate-proton symporter [Holospora obtusa F1]|uniref:Citrate-proton symporter n=1 Tax=Holospora obtusa F1 TaxID=1399147 RepID=W6TEH7_HOLOB|nr:hypothetical protein [Holospora obtusa]ETZ07164.1 citrate-proton symporter [Holospora obtusa F1]
MNFFPHQKARWILISNGLNHGETLAYTLLIPWIIPVFFPYASPETHLAWGYSVLAMGIVTTPLGAVLFSWIAQCVGALFGLKWCLLGKALLTGLFLMCPGYKVLGTSSLALFFLLRFLIGVFSSGLSSISKIYIMEKKNDEKKENYAHRFSYLYQFSTMCGYVGTSILVNGVTKEAFFSWRWIFLPFLLQGGIGMMCIAWLSKNKYFRKAENFISFSYRFFSYRSALELFSFHYKPLCMVSLTTGLSYILWSLAFVMMNGLIPLTAFMSYATAFSANQWFMGVDMALILILGPILTHYVPENILKKSTIIVAISFPMSFFLLDFYPSLIMIMAVRLWIVLWGVIFSCPLHMCYKRCCPEDKIYLIVGLGSTLGGSIIGKLTPILTVWIYHKTGTFFFIGIYTAVIAFLTRITLHFVKPNYGNLG